MEIDIHDIYDGKITAEDLEKILVVLEEESYSGWEAKKCRDHIILARRLEAEAAKKAADKLIKRILTAWREAGAFFAKYNREVKQLIRGYEEKNVEAILAVREEWSKLCPDIKFDRTATRKSIEEQLGIDKEKKLADSLYKLRFEKETQIYEETLAKYVKVKYHDQEQKIILSQIDAFYEFIRENPRPR